MFSYFNSETRFGIISSKRIFETQNERSFKTALFLTPPPLLYFQNFGSQGQGEDEYFKEMAYANVFPQIQAMIKSYEQYALLKKCFRW